MRDDLTQYHILVKDDDKKWFIYDVIYFGHLVHNSGRGYYREKYRTLLNKKEADILIQASKKAATNHVGQL